MKKTPASRRVAASLLALAALSATGSALAAGNAVLAIYQQPETLAGFLLQAPLRPENLALVRQAAPAGGGPQQTLRQQVGVLLSLPEYQLM